MVDCGESKKELTKWLEVSEQAWTDEGRRIGVVEVNEIGDERRW